MERLTIMTPKGPALNIKATTEAAARREVHDKFLQVVAAYYEIEEAQERKQKESGQEAAKNEQNAI